MGTLAAGIAHEINNPLAFITANLSYADEELAHPEAIGEPARLTELRNAIREARDGADRVRNLVSEMRTLARANTAARPISVTGVLNTALDALASEIRARAVLVRRIDPL